MEDVNKIKEAFNKFGNSVSDKTRKTVTAGLLGIALTAGTAYGTGAVINKIDALEKSHISQQKTESISNLQRDSMEDVTNGLTNSEKIKLKELISISVAIQSGIVDSSENETMFTKTKKELLDSYSTLKKSMININELPTELNNYIENAFDKISNGNINTFDAIAYTQAPPIIRDIMEKPIQGYDEHILNYAKYIPCEEPNIDLENEKSDKWLTDSIDAKRSTNGLSDFGDEPDKPLFKEKKPVKMKYIGNYKPEIPTGIGIVFENLDNSINNKEQAIKAKQKIIDNQKVMG